MDYEVFRLGVIVALQEATSDTPILSASDFFKISLETKRILQEEIYAITNEACRMVRQELKNE